MNKTTKATLWILGVFMALSLAVYFAGCGGDDATDAGPIVAACAKAGDACTGGKCIAVVADKPACFLECGTLGDACEGGSCYYSADPAGNFCLPTGAKAVGETCTTANECVQGAVCTGEGTSLSCYLVCSDDAGCTAPATCTDVSLSSKVCTEPATP